MASFNVSFGRAGNEHNCSLQNNVPRHDFIQCVIFISLMGRGRRQLGGYRLPPSSVTVRPYIFKILHVTLAVCCWIHGYLACLSLCCSSAYPGQAGTFILLLSLSSFHTRFTNKRVPRLSVLKLQEITAKERKIHFIHNNTTCV